MVADDSQIHHYYCGTHLLGGYGGIVCCSGGHIYCLSCEIYREWYYGMYLSSSVRVIVGCVGVKSVRYIIFHRHAAQQESREIKTAHCSHNVPPHDATPPPTSAPTRCHDPYLLPNNFPNLVSDVVNHNGEVQLSYLRGVESSRLQTGAQSENRNHPRTAPHGRARAGERIAHLP